MSIQLSPEIEAEILRRVGGVYRTPEEVVLAGVRQIPEPTNGHRAEAPAQTTEEWIASFRAMVAMVQGHGSGGNLDDSRESIYEGRGE